MAKIKTYANDNTINANDRLIGTDFNDSDKTKNYLISALKNYILNGLDTRPYKVYTALLSQSGTNAPVATVLENTLGEVTFSSLDGIYNTATSIGLFTNNKTIVFLGAGNDPAYSNQVFVEDINTILFNVSTSEDAMNNTSIEIRVYN